jgi:hypothetical protein
VPPRLHEALKTAACLLRVPTEFEYTQMKRFGLLNGSPNLFRSSLVSLLPSALGYLLSAICYPLILHIDRHAAGRGIVGGLVHDDELDGVGAVGQAGGVEIP